MERVAGLGHESTTFACVDDRAGIAHLYRVLKSTKQVQETPLREIQSCFIVHSRQMVIPAATIP